MAQIVNIKGTTRQAKVRHPRAAFGLVFLTLGIYYLVWYYKVNRELPRSRARPGREEHVSAGARSRHCRDQLGWLILVPPFVSFYRTFQRIEAAQDVSGTRERVNSWLGLSLYLAGLFTLPVEVIYAQNELNRIWRGEKRIDRRRRRRSACDDPAMHHRVLIVDDNGASVLPRDSCSSEPALPSSPRPRPAPAGSQKRRHTGRTWRSWTCSCRTSTGSRSPSGCPNSTSRPG